MIPHYLLKLKVHKAFDLVTPFGEFTIHDIYVNAQCIY